MASYTFNALHDLAATPASATDTALLLGYDTPGDGGGSPFYWDNSSTAFSDGVMVVQVPGTAQGRWIRITENNTLNIRWFGAKANWQYTNRPDSSTFDNLPAIQAALSFIAANSKYRTIYIPSSPAEMVYFFSDTIHVHTNVSIEGEGNTMYDFPTILGFYNTAGIKFHTASISGGARLNANGGLKRVFVSTIATSPYQEDGKQHGVEADCRMIIEDVSVYYFKGSGFYLYGNAADAIDPKDSTKGKISTNSSLWEMHRCVARFNAEHGIHVEGGDINVGNISTFDATSNKYWGIFDESLLSCVWTNVHTNNNSIYLGTLSRAYLGDLVRIVINGAQEYFACLQDNSNQTPVVGQKTGAWYYLGHLNESDWAGAVFSDWASNVSYKKVYYYVARTDNTNVPPVAGSNSSTWTLVGEAGAFAANIYILWMNTKNFRGGGAMATALQSNNSVFVGPYSEMNQGHILIRGRGFLFGGETGTPVLEGTFMGGGGGLSIPNGSVSAGAGFTSTDNAYSLEFGNYGRDLVRANRTFEYSTGGSFTVSKLNGGPPSFTHDPSPAGQTRFGSHIDRSGKRYQFNYGDVSVLGGNFYSEASDGQLRPLNPFIPITANQYGAHPAFDTSQAAIEWLLGKV